MQLPPAIGSVFDELTHVRGLTSFAVEPRAKLFEDVISLGVLGAYLNEERDWGDVDTVTSDTLGNIVLPPEGKVKFVAETEAIDKLVFTAALPTEPPVTTDSIELVVDYESIRTVAIPVPVPPVIEASLSLGGLCLLSCRSFAQASPVKLGAFVLMPEPLVKSKSGTVADVTPKATAEGVAEGITADRRTSVAVSGKLDAFTTECS